MSFTDLQFIFVFLPIAFLLYYFIPQRFRYAVLLIISLVFYSWGGLRNLWLLLLCTLFTYLAGISVIKNIDEGNALYGKVSFIIGVAGNVLILALYKYFFDKMPVGISFYTFSEISYLCDIYLSGIRPSSNPLDSVLYITFFPKVTSGPIVKFKDFKDQIHNAKVSRLGIERGAYYIIIGLFKKVLIADRLGEAYSAMMGSGSLTVSGAWLAMIYYSLQLYFDFSGYSHMAIGTASMFGYKFDKNFDHPYLSINIQEFWRKWHISLGDWFREYVYIPLGGNRKGTTVQIRNLAIVWILTGIWHGNSLKFAAWGLWHLAFILIYRFLIKDFYDRLHKVIKIICTNLVVFTGWIFFFRDSLGSAFSHMGNLFYSSQGFTNKETLFVFLQYFVLLIIAIICSTNIVDNIDKKFSYGKGKVWSVASIAVKIILLVVCVAEIVSSTFQTFLYFQF